MIEPEQEAACSRLHISNFFDEMRTVGASGRIPSDNIWNFDETMLEWGAKKRAVVISRKSKQAIISMSEKQREHITIGLCVSASGDHMLPIAILPLKTLPTTLDHLSKRFAFSGQDAGWIDGAIFADWVKQVFLPHINSARATPTEPVLLWMDGHASHARFDCIEILKQNHVTVATIPSHTSHLLQPLDKGVNMEFKAKLRKLKPVDVPSDLPGARAKLLEAAWMALHNAHNPSTIMSSWAKTGLYPWNPSVVLDDPTQVNTAPPPTPPKRKAISISGRVLTDDAYIRERTLKDETDAKKRKKIEPVEQGNEERKKGENRDKKVGKVLKKVPIDSKEVVPKGQGPKSKRK